MFKFIGAVVVYGFALFGAGIVVRRCIMLKIQSMRQAAA